MPFWRSYFHLVWTTKDRQSLISESIEPRLYAQMVNKSTEMGCYVHAINGIPDHVHLVLTIPPKHSVAEVVKMLKGASAHFINQVLHPMEFHFQWQRGYGCFSLGHNQLPRAIDYVQSQKEHHAQQTTNAWLERVSELDEGPPLVDDAHAKRTDMLREAPAHYDAWGDTPF